MRPRLIERTALRSRPGRRIEPGRSSAAADLNCFIPKMPRTAAAFDHDRSEFRIGEHLREAKCATVRIEGGGRESNRDAFAGSHKL